MRKSLIDSWARVTSQKRGRVRNGEGSEEQKYEIKMVQEGKANNE